uniref:Uncharacterized protein n=1 Tax=Manihot esculenta TaxID=3983 RepID=A0A2C9V4B9_MANES
MSQVHSSFTFHGQFLMDWRATFNKIHQTRKLHN